MIVSDSLALSNRGGTEAILVRRDLLEL